MKPDVVVGGSQIAELTDYFTAWFLIAEDERNRPLHMKKMVVITLQFAQTNQISMRMI